MPWGLSYVAVDAAIDFLALQGFHEAFRFGVVVRVAHPAHAGQDVVLSQNGAVIAASVLYSAIGMVDQGAGDWSAGSNGHDKRGDGQFGPQMELKRPADNATAEGIDLTTAR